MKIRKRHPETCVEREQNQACLSYAERQQVRQSQLVSGSALLVSASVLALCTLLVGCSSAHQLAHLHQVERDSTYRQQIQYDSIYIYQSHEKDYRRASHPETQDRHPELVSASDLSSSSPFSISSSLNPPDTVVIKDISIEYRYKLLRDTVRIIQRDSIPYEVLVTEIKEVKYIPWWSKALSCVGALCIALIVGKLALKRP